MFPHHNPFPFPCKPLKIHLTRFSGFTTTHKTKDQTYFVCFVAMYIGSSCKAVNGPRLNHLTLFRRVMKALLLLCTLQGGPTADPLHCDNPWLSQSGPECFISDSLINSALPMTCLYPWCSKISYGRLHEHIGS